MDTVILKTLIFLLAFPFYVNSEAFSKDIDRYKSFFDSGGNWVSVRSVMEDLSWSGIRDETLYDQIASELKSSYLESDGPTVERASWLAKALAISGNVKYRELLEQILESAAHKKVKKHVGIAIGRLKDYESWAPIIEANLDSAETAEELDAMRIKNMIEAEDPILVRMGVKRVYYDFRKVESLQDIVETRLINFAKVDRQGKVELDAIAWMAKTLAASGLPKYRAALGELTKSSYPKKVRKYAKKYLESLNESALLETTGMESAGAGMHGNPAHDTLMKMDLDARNQKLAQTVRQSSNLCLKGIKTYFQGISTDASAYWNVRCREKDYLLVFPMDNSLGVTIVGCDKVEQAGYPCFERNAQLLY